MVLLFLDQPIFLILLYGVLGALFMPFMALANLGLLNGRNIPAEWRNNVVQNILLGVTTLLFVILGGYQVWQAVAKVLGG